MPKFETAPLAEPEEPLEEVRPLTPEEYRKAEGFTRPETKERERSPETLMKGLEIFTEVAFSKFEVDGLENLKEIASDKKIVLASTHITDFDMPLAYYAVGNELNVKFTNTRRLTEITGGDPISYIAIKAIGERNFYPIDYIKQKTGEKKYTGKFNPDNFEPMKESLEEGKSDAVLLAAHNPSTNGKMAEKGGYGAAYLAELADAVVVPIAIDIASKKAAASTALGKIKGLFDRPEVKVKIGKSMDLEKIPNLEQFKKLIEKDKTGRLSKEERSEFTEIKNKLAEQSDKIMGVLAEMVPEEKRAERGKKEVA